MSCRNRLPQVNQSPIPSHSILILKTCKLITIMRSVPKTELTTSESMHAPTRPQSTSRSIGQNVRKRRKCLSRFKTSNQIPRMLWQHKRHLVLRSRTTQNCSIGSWSRVLRKASFQKLPKRIRLLKKAKNRQQQFPRRARERQRSPLILLPRRPGQKLQPYLE